MADLDRFPGRTHQHGGGADLADPVDHRHELHAVGEHHRDAVTGTNASPGEVAGVGVGQSVELGEGPTLVPGQDGDARTSTGRRLFESRVHDIVGRRNCHRVVAARARSSFFSTLPVAFSGRLVDDLDHPRHFVVRHLVAAPRLDLLGRSRIAGRRDDEGHAHFTEALVGNTDDGRLANVGMTQQRVLDLGRIRVEAAHDEHVFEPANNPEIAAFVEHTEVTRSRASHRPTAPRWWPLRRRDSRP